MDSQLSTAGDSERPVVGVNLVGYFDSPLGLGEVARQVHGALRAAGVPVETFTLPERRTRGTPPSPPPTRPPFPTTLLCVNAAGMEGARDWLGPGFFTAGRVIAIWWWEAPAFPDRWRRAFDGLDEIWVGSRFVADALAPVSPVPVLTMPLPAGPRDVVERTRGQLGLPDGYLFLFVFDFASGFERKNPLAVARAFTEAFPEGSGATLAIKHLGGEEYPAQLDCLERAAGRHADVHLVEGYLDPGEQAALTAACDCYVSLHRSEGFGLTIAEAVLAGRPVVTTGYSGPLEFLGPDTAQLVDYELKPIGEGNEPYPPESLWAEPDVGHAATLMHAVQAEPGPALERAQLARRRFVAAHSPGRAGSEMAARLERLDGLATPSPAGSREPATAELERRLDAPAVSPGGLRGWARTLVLRLMAPHTVDQLRVDREVVRVLRGLEERLNGIERAQASLRAEFDGHRRSSDHVDAQDGERSDSPAPERP